MKKKYIGFLFFWLVAILNAQDYSALWKGHFSYLNINDIVQGNGKVFAASENAIFVYDIQTKELETMTSYMLERLP